MKLRLETTHKSVEILGYHGGEYEDYGVWDVVQCGLIVFWVTVVLENRILF